MVKILGFVRHLKTSPLFYFVLAILVAFGGGGVQSFKNVKTVFNFRAIEKEVIDWIWLIGWSLPSPGLEQKQCLYS